MSTPIEPALTPTEWVRRQSGVVSVETVEGTTRIAVCDPEGNLATVAGDNRLFALIALANCAMSDEDPRKLCRTDLAVFSVLMEEYHRTRGADLKISRMAMALYDKLCALLPAPPRKTPPSGSEAQRVSES
jgi:hypothetical protein